MKLINIAITTCRMTGSILLAAIYWRNPHLPTGTGVTFQEYESAVTSFRRQGVEIAHQIKSAIRFKLFDI